MKDPYTVLGVSPNATDDEIKKAYRALAKKYHPDNYDDSNPLKDLASEKMREINEAYDTIRNRKTGSRSTGGSSTGSSEFYRIRTLITQGRYTEAGRYLDMTPVSDRNGEWHYLKGVILIKRGYMMDGAEHIRRATEIDPNNTEYRDAYNMFVNSGYSPYSSGRPVGNVSYCPCSVCDVCTMCLCADMCCDCLR